jgi:hypothetical protein
MTDQYKAELCKLWDQASETEQAQMLVLLADAIEGDIPSEVADIIAEARQRIAEES